MIALEPDRKCAAHCTYCFAEINSKHQLEGESKNLYDTGSFERTLEKAYSPAYDPTHFLQWALRNKLTLGYANTVEPFQNVDQANSLLKILDNYGIPLFVQTKGLNFFEVADRLKPFHDNSTVFVSIPSLDPRVIKRFEPGTPPIEERLKVIEWLCDNGFYVIGALSPYHEDWNENPVELVNTLADHGVCEIFFDRLHLNQRQMKKIADPWVAKNAGGRGMDWPDKAYDHLHAIYQAADSNDLHFFTTSFFGTIYGWLNTIPTISPPSCFSRGMSFPYHDGAIFYALENMFYFDDDKEISVADRDFNDSIILKWDTALELMELAGKIDQPFSYSSLRDLVAIEKKIPEIYKDNFLKPQAPMREFFRAIWNNPHTKSFVSRHPWIRIAMKPDETPWTDDQGNLIYIFDPDYIEGLTSGQRTVEDIGVFREIVSEEFRDTFEDS